VVNLRGCKARVIIIVVQLMQYQRGFFGRLLRFCLCARTAETGSWKLGMWASTIRRKFPGKLVPVCIRCRVYAPETVEQFLLNRRRVLHQPIMPFKNHQLQQQCFALVWQQHGGDFTGYPAERNALAPQDVVQGQAHHLALGRADLARFRRRSCGRIRYPWPGTAKAKKFKQAVCSRLAWKIGEYGCG
jgi:hypothetical protein